MSMLAINWHPSRKDLRAFAAIWFVFFGLIGVWFYLGGGTPWAYNTLWGIAIAGGALGLAAPVWLRLVYVGWMLAAYPIGWLVSHLILAFVFYGLLLPIGLACRVLGYDPMHRAIKRGTSSYWTERLQAVDIKRYFRQF